MCPCTLWSPGKKLTVGSRYSTHIPTTDPEINYHACKMGCMASVQASEDMQLQVREHVPRKYRASASPENFVHDRDWPQWAKRRKRAVPRPLYAPESRIQQPKKGRVLERRGLRMLQQRLYADAEAPAEAATYPPKRERSHPHQGLAGGQPALRLECQPDIRDSSPLLRGRPAWCAIPGKMAPEYPYKVLTPTPAPSDRTSRRRSENTLSAPRLTFIRFSAGRRRVTGMCVS